MDKGLEEVLAAQRLSDCVYEFFTKKIGSSLEQAEDVTHSPDVMKQFSLSAGGTVLRFQGQPLMHHDHGEPVKNFLKTTRREHFLPLETTDAAKAPEVPETILQAARSGNMTARTTAFKLVHGTKAKSEEAASLAMVEALIAGKASEPTDVDLIPDDRTRRAARATQINHANNPWGPGPAWNITRQGEIVKKLGVEAAAGIAASVGSHIGATRPSKVMA